MMLTAHTGCDGTPDNSLDFVRYVLTLSPDAFEVDVHLRKDGVLIIAHDADDSSEYAEWPTLAEVFTLAAAHPHIGINCDCKDYGLEKAVIALHNDLAPENPLFLSGSVSPDTLRANPAILSNARILLNAEEIVPDFYETMLRDEEGQLFCAEQAVRVCQSCGVDIVNVYYIACTPTFLTALRDQQIGVSVWTIDEPEDARAFAKRNVFNITTRNAKTLLELLK